MKIGTNRMGRRPGLGLLALSTAITQAQYIYLGSYDLRGIVYGGFRFSDGMWAIKQDGAVSLQTGARRDSPKGFWCAFNVMFTNEEDSNAFRYYCVQNAEDSNIAFFVRDYSWFFRVWGVGLRQLPIDEGSPMDYLYSMYEVVLYFYSPYTYQVPAATWYTNNATLPQQSPPLANLGHYETSLQSLRVVCHYNAAHVKALTMNVQGGEALTITDEALSEEVWELNGETNQLYETFIDAMASISQFNQDVPVAQRVGTIDYSSSKLRLNNAASAYWILSGPNQVKNPIVMTADLSLDAGGATGLAYVEISSNGQSWETALTQADFESGQAEYVLEDTEYKKNIYVRFRNASGTSGKYLRIGYLKFEVERWVEDASIPTVPVGYSKAAILDATGGSKLVDVLAYFRSIRHMV
jgi:hypothetical protein